MTFSSLKEQHKQNRFRLSPQSHNNYNLLQMKPLLLLAVWLAFLSTPLMVMAEQKFLYNAMPEGESDPVIDYVPPKTNLTKNNMGGSELEQPNFLFSTMGPGAVARVVEFYAPWCPHCQHFAPKYVQFARRMRDIVKPYGIVVDFYAVSCTVNKKLCKHQEIHGYPTVKVIPANSYNATVIKYYDLHPFQVLRDIGIEVDMVDMKNDDETTKDNKNSQQKQQRQQHDASGKDATSTKKFVLTLPKQHKRTKADIYADAYKSFHFAMKTGVFMANGPLPNKTSDTLHEWLNLLQDTLPPTWNIHPLIRKLLNEFETIIQGEDQLVEVLGQFPPPNEEWTHSCTHGQEAMGYTCGLWELFHIMTVGVVQYNEKVITDDGYAFYRTEAVAEDLRNYIGTFFGCEVCRMNFLESFDNCGLDRCNRLNDQVGDLTTWKQLPLWLFEMHNAVNVRLMKEQAERDNRQTTHHDEVHAQWPSRLDCPKCWRWDGSWDEDLIYLYLLDQYWPDDGSLPKDESRRFLFQSVVSVEPDDMEEEGFFSSFIMYGLLLALVITIGYFYKKRSDLWKTGKHKKRDY